MACFNFEVQETRLKLIKKMSDTYEDSVWFIPATDVVTNKAEPLGKGGYGEVYPGIYGTIPVAIKTITGLDNPEAVQTAKSEATLWYSLKHPNITQLYGVAVDEHGNPTLIIERAEKSLYSCLYCANGEEPVSKEVKMRWILQIAQAFKYLHAQTNPVIHADLNPRNVLIDYDGTAKIKDFGLSRRLLASHTSSLRAHEAIRYSPPELFGRKYKPTTAHDVYSFAMTAYEILSNIQPFDDAVVPEVIPTWVIDGERPESKPDQIPEDSWEWSLIQACWRQDPTERPSFEEIVKIIQDHADIPKLGRQSPSLFKNMSDAFEDSVWFIPAAEVTVNRDELLGQGRSRVSTGYYGINPVAIRTITHFYAPKAVKMVKSEATIWHTLRHPNITPFYGVSVDDFGNPMLIIERAETSLFSRLYEANNEEPVSKEVKMCWILQIAQAFKYLHAQKNPIIHADLNPRKVLIGYDGIAKITDFGLSRRLLASSSLSRQSHETMRYSPPESFDRKYTATTAHDVYSFAMTIYEILSEVQPFCDANCPENIPVWVKDGERPFSQPDRIPEDSWEWSLIQACWDQDPTKRPSFEEIVKTIQCHSDLISLSKSISARLVSPIVPARTSPMIDTSSLAASSEDDPDQQ